MDVILLSQQDCRLCEQAKATIARLALDHALTVTEIELASPDGQALAARGGMLFPPGVFLDGEPFSYGRLSERKLRKEIERRLGIRRHG